MSGGEGRGREPGGRRRASKESLLVALDGDRRRRANQGSAPRVGISERFRPEDTARADRALGDLDALGVNDLRLVLDPRDWDEPTHARFYDRLLGRLGAALRVLPSVSWPTFEPSLPPAEVRALARLVRHLVEVCPSPSRQVEVDLFGRSARADFAAGCVVLDLEERVAALADVLGEAAAHGIGVALALPPLVPDALLEHLERRGVLDHVVAVTVAASTAHGVGAGPGMEAYRGAVQRCTRALRAAGRVAPIWITEAGLSSAPHREARQVAELVAAIEAPAERVYWHTLHDAVASEGASAPSSGASARSNGTSGAVPRLGRVVTDAGAHHRGLLRADGKPKVLYRLWAEGGLAHVCAQAPLARRKPTGRPRRPATLITGGAGFIGSNLASRLLEDGHRVVLLDDLSRPLVERNVRALRERHGGRVELSLSDVRDERALRDALRGAERVFHFAAQVAVTLSLGAPRHDLSVNGLGTLNVLECLRELDDPPPLFFTSTNKVYGALPDVDLEVRGKRYEPVAPEIRRNGIDERRPLDFYSPYGCSKGVADQYVLDYARTFGLATTVFRMSCIYGPRQFGNEEQGWVAHFLNAALTGQPITVFGDGLQVRDLLFVDDLVEAFVRAAASPEKVAGQAFNVGGGPENTLSLLELVDFMREHLGLHVPLRFEGFRPGDQRYYVSDVRKLTTAVGFRPETGVARGLARLLEWLRPSAGGSAAMQAAPGGLEP